MDKQIESAVKQLKQNFWNFLYFGYGNTKYVKDA